ncbi:SUKH-4 family immunity protein [Streptomyces sp. NPDC085466]|uniref:SUKH-4 family immunity protein n=1 Tax=Streptomyces sp. NPDC085466 TaxID=3365725 RepID=UPI0037D77EA5
MTPQKMVESYGLQNITYFPRPPERGQAEYRGTNRDDDAARDAVVTRMRQDITTVDPTPFADDESRWSRLFEEVCLGMWG